MADFPGAVDITTANGLFKKVYGDLENLIPVGKKVAEMIPFLPKAKTGESYNTAVILG
jgi:hypothetical protein